MWPNKLNWRQWNNEMKNLKRNLHAAYHVCGIIGSAREIVASQTFFFHGNFQFRSRLLRPSRREMKKGTSNRECLLCIGQQKRMRNEWCMESLAAMEWKYLFLVERKMAMISIRRRDIIVKLYFLTHQIWINNVSAPRRRWVRARACASCSAFRRSTGCTEIEPPSGIGADSVFTRRLHQANCHRVHF